MEFARGFGVDLPIERYPPFDYSAFSEWFEGFKQILDRHVIAIQVRRHIKTDPGVVDGLYLSPHYRDEIHGLLNRIRKIVNAADLPEDKKNAIYDKIASLQAEVDRSKTRFHVVLSYLLDLTKTAKEGAEDLAPARKQIERVMEAFGQAKADHDVGKLPRPENMERLPPPEDPVSDELGDDIPF